MSKPDFYDETFNRRHRYSNSDISYKFDNSVYTDKFETPKSIISVSRKYDDAGNSTIKRLDFTLSRGKGDMSQISDKRRQESAGDFLQSPECKIIYR